MADWLAIEQEGLQALAAIDPRSSPARISLTYEAFRYGRTVAVEGFRYPAELLPVQPVRRVCTCSSRCWLRAAASTRSGRRPTTRTSSRAWTVSSTGRTSPSPTCAQGVEKGFVQPRVVVERVIAQLEALGAGRSEAERVLRPAHGLPGGRARGRSATPDEGLRRETRGQRAPRLSPDARLPRDGVPPAGAGHRRLVRAAERRRVVRLPRALSHQHPAHARGGPRARPGRGGAAAHANGPDAPAARPHRATSAASSRRCAPTRPSSSPIRRNCSPAIARSRRG